MATVLEPMWTFVDGRAEVIRTQQPTRAFGYHVAMGGGVLNTGESWKDLDLYYLPLDNGVAPNAEALIAYLTSLWGEPEDIAKTDYPDQPESLYKAKLKFTPLGKRIDVFVIGG